MPDEADDGNRDRRTDEVIERFRKVESRGSVAPTGRAAGSCGCRLYLLFIHPRATELD